MIRSKIKRECVQCKISDTRLLVVHHLDHNRTNNKLSNLVWICFNCHHLVHTSRDVEQSLLKDLDIIKNGVCSSVG